MPKAGNYLPEKIRSAIASSIPASTSAHGQTPELKNLYVPLRHTQALSPDHPLVVGIRGAGKSVWWSALQSDDHRNLVSKSIPDALLNQIGKVSAGFGESPQPEDFPDKRTIGKILSDGYPASQIWRAIIAWHTFLKSTASSRNKLESWIDRVKWLDQNPEKVSTGFYQYDQELIKKSSIHLILFDALDRAADDWGSLQKLLKGLLEILLEFRTYKYIRAKAFVRPDMLDDPAVTAFRDSSKITANRVELRWEKLDLYSLLWQRLGNASLGGADFRKLCKSLGSKEWKQVAGTWVVPIPLRDDVHLQRETFHRITGEWMGTDQRRGFPYTWLPNHLADAAEQVSPRSFLSAIRVANEQPVHTNWKYALHYEAIKTGVQEASRIRVDEVREDFFWISDLMEPLKGLVIPCEFEEIVFRWTKEKVLNNLSSKIKRNSELEPKHFTDGHVGLMRDLLELRIFSKMNDDRINMPDVYRIGFGLGRKGGVKPIK